MSGFWKAAKLAAWVVLALITIFFVWGNLVFWATIFSPKKSVFLVASAIGFYIFTAEILINRKFRKIFWNLKEKIAALGAAYIVDAIVNWLISYPLYTYVINEWGMMRGGAIMIGVSIFVCLIYLVIYDFCKYDFFGLEVAKEFGWQSWRSCILRWITKKTEQHRWLTFVLLAFWKDSFYATMFWRRPEQKYRGLSLKGWGVLFLAILIENVPWIPTISGAIWIWKFDLDAVWPYVEGGFFYTLRLFF